MKSRRSTVRSCFLYGPCGFNRNYYYNGVHRYISGITLAAEDDKGPSRYRYCYR